MEASNYVHIPKDVVFLVENTAEEAVEVVDLCSSSSDDEEDNDDDTTAMVHEDGMHQQYQQHQQHAKSFPQSPSEATMNAPIHPPASAAPPLTTSSSSIRQTFPHQYNDYRAIEVSSEDSEGAEIAQSSGKKRMRSPAIFFSDDDDDDDDDDICFMCSTPPIHHDHPTRALQSLPDAHRSSETFQITTLTEDHTNNTDEDMEEEHTNEDRMEEECTPQRQSQPQPDSLEPSTADPQKQEGLQPRPRLQLPSIHINPSLLSRLTGLRYDDSLRAYAPPDFDSNSATATATATATSATTTTLTDPDSKPPAAKSK